MKKQSLLVVAASLSAGLLLAGCAATDPSANAQSATPQTSPVPPPAPPEPPVEEENPYMGLEQQELDTKLIEAAWENDVETSELLIEAGADVNAKDSTVQSAYLVTTSEGYLPLLELTLQHGGDVTSLDSFNGTGLIRASERGHAGVVGRLIQADIDLDHVNNPGWVALHEALMFTKPDAVSNYIDTVRVLVAGGADVTIKTQRDGLSPTQLAEQHGLQPQLELLRAAIDADQISQDEADQRLLAAAKNGNADAAALALRAGADIETQNGLEQTPLLVASTHDNVDVARLLVALGADPDALDYRHDTPWLVTGVTGSVAMLEALLPANPDMTIPNRFGGLSPIPAGERGHADYIQRVVSTGVDLDHVNDLGWTALLETVVYGDGSDPYQRIVHTLIEAGADINIADRNGVTALEHAKSRGFTEIVDALENA